MERDVTVQEVMDREYVGVSESDGLEETAELMLSEGVESVVVLRGAEPVGVVTERDALAALVGAGAGSTGENAGSSVGDEGPTAADAMTEAVPTVEPDARIGEAADRMSAAATKHVLVSDGDEPVGVLTEHDLITTSPFAPAVGPVDTDPERATASVPAGRGSTDVGDDQRREFEDQSICEACGALSRDLSPFNGQLLCPDCRDL